MPLMPVAGAKPRIGVFGGAFDPPHAAHIALVRAALSALQLDELRVIPTGNAWHKARPLSPAQHRLAMVRLAFADIPKVVVDARETERDGPSYTIDTLRELKTQWPESELFVFLGEDQARALPTWRAWQQVLQLAIIYVAERGDWRSGKPRFIAPKLYESRFRHLQMQSIPVSATDIRNRVAAHQDLSPLVLESVARYIDHHHLYQTT
ncbi:MAG: nicotinate (nicotinamide) nucleotide adenylyltransferase [Rhodoferax sp.]